jgi:hypothetical protein
MAKYTGVQDSNYIVIYEDGKPLTLPQVVERLNQLQVISDKWDALDEEIGGFYNPVDLPGDEYDEDSEEDDEEEGNLLGIGEAAATAFGYL